MWIAPQLAQGRTCGDAWATAVSIVLGAPHRKALHLLVRITEPGEEDQTIRQAVDDLLVRRGKPTVATVVNTIFPVHLARICDSPEQLAKRYRDLYPYLRAENPRNRRGTYFGRLVAHPADGTSVDQLTRIISRLRDHGSRRNHHSAVYEVTFDAADDPAIDAELGPGTVSYSAPIYQVRSDAMPLGFPCLSHLSFQHAEGRLHALAQFRSQYLIERAYGNYLALGLLQRYVATAAGLSPGELTVAVGVAHIDSPVGVVKRTLSELTQIRIPGV